jgi:hypothetical protein
VFTTWSLKKYFNKLLPRLEKRYGKQANYSASQVRATIYQCDFNPKHLMLGYVLALNEKDLAKVIAREFPDLCLADYKKHIKTLLTTHQDLKPSQAMFARFLAE